MSPCVSQAGLLLERVYLPPPNTPNRYIIAGARLQKIVASLGRSESHRVMLDAALTSAHRARTDMSRRFHSGGIVPGPGGDGNLLGFTKALWGPRGTAQGDRCLLCMVTFDHKVLLIAQCGVNWRSVFDLSSLWFKFSSEEGKPILDQYEGSIRQQGLHHHKFIAQTSFLGVADIIWIGTLRNASGETLHVLCLVTVSSHVGLINIPTFDTEDAFTPSVLDCFHMDASNGKVSALYWLSIGENKGFLSIGTIKGHVEIYLVAYHEDVFTKNHVYTFENTLQDMHVNHVAMACLEKDLYACFVGKHNILFSHLLRLDGSFSESLASTHCFIGCYAISGLRVVNLKDSTLVYVSVKDGKLLKLDVEYDRTSISFQNKETLFFCDGVLYTGFCFSPNYAFLAILECVSVPYDHLVMKEPTVLSLLQVNTFDTLREHVLKNESQSLSEQVDIFESLRLMTYRMDDRAFQTLTSEEITVLTTIQKRVYLWLTIIELGSLSKNDPSPKKEEKKAFIKALEESILSDYILDVLTALDKNNFPQNSLHLHSLYQMSNFLKRTQQSHPVLKSLRTFLKKEKATDDELCLVCQSVVEFTDIKVVRCSQGHSLPRCIRSLVPTLPVLTCVNCELFYHPNASKWYGEDAITCLICSRKLLYKVRKRFA